MYHFPWIKKKTWIIISNKSKVWKYLNHWMYWKWIFSLLSSFFVSFDITMFAKTSFSFRQMQLLRLYSNSLNETIKENNGRVIVNRKPPTVHYTYKAKTYLYPPMKSCLNIFNGTFMQLISFLLGGLKLNLIYQNVMTRVCNWQQL